MSGENNNQPVNLQDLDKGPLAGEMPTIVAEHGETQKKGPFGKVMAGLAGLAFVGAAGYNVYNDNFKDEKTTVEATDEVVPADSSTTIPGSGRLVIDGSDEDIANEADFTACGAEERNGPWINANFEANQLSLDDNQDLLESKQQVLIDKIGLKAATIMSNGVIIDDSVQDEHLSSDSLYTRVVARGTTVELNDQTKADSPSRENYRCVQEDGEGLGDRSEFYDVKSNKGEVTLLGVPLTEDEYNAAVAASKSEGKDFEGAMIVQSEAVTLVDEDGNEFTETIRFVMFEDDSCGNQVFETTGTPKTPETPTTTIPVTVPPTIVTGPTTTTTVESKNDDGSPGVGDQEEDAAHDGSAGDVTGAGEGAPGQDVDSETGLTPNETSAPTQPSTTVATSAPEGLPEVTITIPATTTPQPEETNPPVTANGNTTVKVQTAPIPVKP